MAVYCSYVPGAFDRVPVARLAAKQRAPGTHAGALALLESGLAPKSAAVVVNGEKPTDFATEDMVCQ